MSGRAAWLVAAAALLAAGAWWLLREEQSGGAAREPVPVASDDEVTSPQAGDATAPAGRVELPQLTARPAPRSRPEDPKSSTAESAAPDQHRSDAFISGWLVTPHGVLLADHGIELLGQHSTGKFGWSSEGKAATSSSGRFYFRDVSPGPKRLQISGPGAGDLREVYRSWQRRSDREARPDEVVARADEGEVFLLVPETGAGDVTVVSSAHPEFWVLGHLGKLPVDPGTHGEHATDVLSAYATDAAGNRGSSDPAIEPLGAGPLLATAERNYDTSSVSPGLVLAPAWNPNATLLVIDVSWCRDISLAFTPPEPGGLVDVGPLSTEPAGRIRAHAVFGKVHQDVFQPSLVCWFRGGGHPDAQAKRSWDDDQDAWVFATDRAAGTWELTATARDFSDGHLSGDLKPFLDIEVNVELTPVPR